MSWDLETDLLLFEVLMERPSEFDMFAILALEVETEYVIQGYRGRIL